MRESKREREEQCVCVCARARAHRGSGHPSLTPRRLLADHHAIECARMRDGQRETGATAITGNSVVLLTLMLPVTSGHLDETEI